jgi:hypothetical protein
MPQKKAPAPQNKNNNNKSVPNKPRTEELQTPSFPFPSDPISALKHANRRTGASSMARRIPREKENTMGCCVETLRERRGGIDKAKTKRSTEREQQQQHKRRRRRRKARHQKPIAASVRQTTTTTAARPPAGHRLQ